MFLEEHSYFCSTAFHEIDFFSVLVPVFLGLYYFCLVLFVESLKGKFKMYCVSFKSLYKFSLVKQTHVIKNYITFQT